VEGDCVLWLVSDNEESNRNLLRQAEERGIESKRVVLAERRDFEQHIRRAAAADLVADRSTQFYY
jgi:predicted O-linked N-acetylglucosamine transferase (SPINDLY family)